MSVVVTSVIILFALIFLGFFLGKGKVIRKDSIPDMSSLVLNVTMPVTIFCSIVDQQGDTDVSECIQVFILTAALYGLSFLITWLAIKPLRIDPKDRGPWLYSGLIPNSGFMGLPLALAVFGSRGMFLLAIGNIICNLTIFSIGIILMTRHYPVKGKIGIRQMLLNNANIAVVVGLLFLLFHIPLPDVAGQLLTYLGNITSGLSMLVIGLSLSRMAFKEVFSDRKMFLLPVLRLVAIPLIVFLIFRLLPFDFDPVVEGVIILTASLPAASTQTMIAEQYDTNTEGASRAVFLTTLFSVVSVPLMMMLVL